MQSNLVLSVNSLNVTVNKAEALPTVFKVIRVMHVFLSEIRAGFFVWGKGQKNWICRDRLTR